MAVVDYLHCVLLGVVRQFVTLWFDSSNHLNAWYIDRRIHGVDAQLLSICPPSEITRAPRKPSHKEILEGLRVEIFSVVLLLHTHIQRGGCSHVILSVSSSIKYHPEIYIIYLS